MDNNNMYGQENQNTEQQSAYGQSYWQAYDQNQNQDYNQNYNQGYNPNYNQNYQQPYNQPYQQAYQPYGDFEEPVSFGDWMLTFIVMMVPCVNIIMMFVWAFSSGTKKSKSNYFKATLVMMLISAVLSFIILFVFSAAAYPLLEHVL